MIDPFFILSVMFIVQSILNLIIVKLKCNQISELDRIVHNLNYELVKIVGSVNLLKKEGKK